MSIFHPGEVSSVVLKPRGRTAAERGWRSPCRPSAHSASVQARSPRSGSQGALRGPGIRHRVAAFWDPDAGQRSLFLGIQRTQCCPAVRGRAGVVSAECKGFCGTGSLKWEGKTAFFLLPSRLFHCIIVVIVDMLFLSLALPEVLRFNS